MHWGWGWGVQEWTQAERLHVVANTWTALGHLTRHCSSRWHSRVWSTQHHCYNFGQGWGCLTQTQLPGSPPPYRDSGGTVRDSMKVPPAHPQEMCLYPVLLRLCLSSGLRAEGSGVGYSRPMCPLRVDSIPQQGDCVLSMADKGVRRLLLKGGWGMEDNELSRWWHTFGDL